jgi:hypothetical protein
MKVPSKALVGLEWNISRYIKIQEATDYVTGAFNLLGHVCASTLAEPSLPWLQVKGGRKAGNASDQMNDWKCRIWQMDENKN